MAPDLFAQVAGFLRLGALAPSSVAAAAFELVGHGVRVVAQVHAVAGVEQVRVPLRLPAFGAWRAWHPAAQQYDPALVVLGPVAACLASSTSQLKLAGAVVAVGAAVSGRGELGAASGVRCARDAGAHPESHVPPSTTLGQPGPKSGYDEGPRVQRGPESK